MKDGSRVSCLVSVGQAETVEIMYIMHGYVWEFGTLKHRIFKYVFLNPTDLTNR